MFSGFKIWNNLWHPQGGAKSKKYFIGLVDNKKIRAYAKELLQIMHRYGKSQKTAAENQVKNLYLQLPTPNVSKDMTLFFFNETQI